MNEPKRLDTGLLLQVFQVVLVLMGGLWAVSKISTTTETLGVEIRHLSKAVESLAGDQRESRTQIGAHETRLQLLEKAARR